MGESVYLGAGQSFGVREVLKFKPLGEVGAHEVAFRPRSCAGRAATYVVVLCELLGRHASLGPGALPAGAAEDGGALIHPQVACVEPRRLSFGRVSCSARSTRVVTSRLTEAGSHCSTALLKTVVSPVAASGGALTSKTSPGVYERSGSPGRAAFKKTL